MPKKEWAFGRKSSGGQVYMNPSEGIDIIFYNAMQTWMVDEEGN